MRLTAHVGERAARDEVTEHGEGASVAFCAGATPTATLDVETRGSSPWWVLEVWPIAEVKP